MARLSRTAATDESTPPDSPRMTRSLPSCCFSSATVESTNEAALHSCREPQTSTTKLRSSCVPCRVWNTSGWNCTAKTGDGWRVEGDGWRVEGDGHQKAALRTSFVEPMTSKPSGMLVMVSPWLIHTCEPCSKPLNSGLPRSMVSRLARPYSRESPFSTRPPSAWLMNCAP